MRLGTSRFAGLIARVLRRAARRKRAHVSWGIDLGPVFANSLAQIAFEGRAAQLVVLQARPHAEGIRPEFDTAFELDLVAGSVSRREEVGRK
jgi:hypothetical protein